MTQNKARRTNEIDFLQLPWAPEVRGLNPRAPTKNIQCIFFSLFKTNFTPNLQCGMLARRRSQFATPSVPETCCARKIQERKRQECGLLNYSVGTSYLPYPINMGEIQGTPCIPRKSQRLQLTGAGV
jgi:hypothetical protein